MADDGFKAIVARFSKADKETLKAFTNFNETALQPGSLDRKTKTLWIHLISFSPEALVNSLREICVESRKD